MVHGRTGHFADQGRIGEGFSPTAVAVKIDETRENISRLTLLWIIWPWRPYGGNMLVFPLHNGVVPYLGTNERTSA